jgi:putative transposase
VPRDRQASFAPQLIAKYQRRFPGFDDKIISMYARGMSTREIVGHLRDLYGIEVSPDLIGAVADAVLEAVAAWQARPLETVYPLIFFDAPRVKIRDEGLVRNKPAPAKAGGGAHCAWRARRRQQGNPGALARTERRRQILPPGQARGSRTAASGTC